MICTLTARRLKPGTFDAFRAEFESMGEKIPEEILRRWKNVYVTRDVTDPDVALTFGFFDGTLEELREIQDVDPGPPDAVAGFVDEVLLDGSYEVVAEITP
jgi:hypothetical protein